MNPVDETTAKLHDTLEILNRVDEHMSKKFDGHLRWTLEDERTYIWRDLTRKDTENILVRAEKPPFAKPTIPGYPAIRTTVLLRVSSSLSDSLVLSELAEYTRYGKTDKIFRHWTVSGNELNYFYHVLTAKPYDSIVLRIEGWPTAVKKSLVPFQAEAPRRGEDPLFDATFRGRAVVKYMSSKISGPIDEEADRAASLGLRADALVKASSTKKPLAKKPSAKKSHGPSPVDELFFF